MKAVSKQADEDKQQDALGISTQALTKSSIEKDMVAYIKKEFDKKYFSALYSRKKLRLLHHP